MNRKYLMTGLVLIGSAAVLVFFMRAAVQASSLESGALSSRTKGPESAPVHIAEFSDFQCPACKKAQPVLDAMMEKYSGQVRLTFHHFPLPGHLWAAPAHQAAECAGQQGKFWPYHDRLYAEQESWSGPANPMETFMRFARDVGLQLDDFAGCLSDERVRKIILEDKKAGEGMKVRSTPTFFVNEELIVGPIQLELKVDEIIEAELEKQP